ncbi:hypothetical protein IFM89_006826 [Coptis chinensis]|uniref:Uncharacterized protein n=1 Tax=Coptis chinensis TaxID=261450 RepID=A0A835M7A2_9MAGN|nr:hypothetical protein IFM89_006826 [Coptis chinensis]
MAHKQHARDEDDKPPYPESTNFTRWADIVAWAEEDQNGDRSQDQEENSQDSKYGKPKWQLQQSKTPATRSRSRGIANDKTQNRLSKLINKWDPDIVGIAEPKINPRDISSAYLQSLGMSASFHSNDRQNSVPNIWLL